MTIDTVSPKRRSLGGASSDARARAQLSPVLLILVPCQIIGGVLAALLCKPVVAALRAANNERLGLLQSFDE